MLPQAVRGPATTWPGPYRAPPHEHRMTARGGASSRANRSCMYFSPIAAAADSARPPRPDVSVNALIRRIGVIGNHLPRQCGIATFTTHLSGALADASPGIDCFVVAM